MIIAYIFLINNMKIVQITALYIYIPISYTYLRITSGAIYSGVPKTCLSENCRVSLSTCTSYKLVATVTIKILYLLILIETIIIA